MADVKWIRIMTDIFDNKKIRMIEALPDGDTLIVIWLKILTLAGKTNVDGFLYFVKEVPFTEQMLATYFGRPLTTIQLALSTFENYQMIEIVDDVICVANWERYQNTEGLEKIREQTRKRVAKHRELKKLECNVTSNVTVTQCNATDIDIDIDKDIDKKRNIYSANFEAFWKVYPRKSDKGQANKAYSARLKEGFSEDELLEAAKNYAEECKKDRREEKYIKLAKTFIGSSTPFVDYLPKQLSNGFEYDDEGNLLYNIDEAPEAPPFYTLPPQWFDQDNNLIREKVTPIKQRALIERGFNQPIIYPVNDILEKYDMLREYFDNLKEETEG